MKEEDEKKSWQDKTEIMMMGNTKMDREILRKDIDTEENVMPFLY